MDVVVYKYVASNSMELPKKAVFIHAGNQPMSGSFINMWFVVDPNETETVVRKFAIVPTGAAFDNKGLTFLQTVFVGPLVYHIFEESEDIQ